MHTCAIHHPSGPSPRPTGPTNRLSQARPRAPWSRVVPRSPVRPARAACPRALAIKPPPA
jgi:hypothetical protein